jgi:serine/threonine protein kinase/tetratricopeptide (TPR) repeat protein
MAVGPAELRTLSRLLDEALALDPSERSRWLASLSGSDAGHRNTLAQLLAEADRPDDRFLTRPKLGRPRGSAHGPPNEQAGMRIGPYRLERQIGVGGMGSVWLAQRVDGGLERAVALKLPHVSWVPELNARLARERDILARLAHPNIARLYDAGTDEQGRPYLALEYVEGLPIDEYLRQHSLGLRERLVLFKQVAGAVAYAHRHLVVHRDLKPSNVLVGVDGTAHLLDFGIAKLLSDEADGMTLLTGAAGRMLTPGYASPEQIRGEPVTVAADVYSLGVLLYEMLTGTRPFHTTGASLTELEAAAIEELAPLASSRVTARPTQRALRGDLDTILAKALRREPESRYRTVDALIDDLDRHLNGEPVLARPDSGWYRASRFISRHREYVVAASLALVAVLIGFGVAVEQAKRAAREAQRAQAQAERANEMRDFVVGLFDLNHGDDPNKLQWQQFTAHDLVERGARRVAARYERQPALRAEMLGIAGTIFADIGDPKHAADMAQRQLAALDAAPDNWHERVAALRVLARAQVQQLQYELAETTLNQAIREIGANRGQDAVDVHTALAHIQLVRSEYAAANEHLDRAEALLDAANDRRSLSYAALLRERSFLLLWDRRDPAAARAMFKRARELTENLSSPLSAESIALKKRFALNLVQYGDVDSGRTLFDELLSAIRRASGDDDLEGISLELDLVFRLNDLRALRDDGIGRLEKIAVSLDHHGSAVPAPLRLYADLVTGAAYTQHGDIQLAEAPMKRAYQLLNAGPADVSENPVYSVKQVAMFFYAQWADEAGQHDVSTALWDEIYRLRKASLGAASVRNDEVIDPELDAIRSRIMGADLSGASERLARVKQQLGAGQPTLVNIHWDAGVEALALELLLDIESGKMPEAKRLIGERWHGATKNPFSDLLVYTLWPAGFDALQAIVNCGTGHAAEGLDRLTSLVNTHKDRLSSINPTLAYLRSQGGLCALQAGQPARAREMQAAARRAFASQSRVSAFYKRPLLELERRLARNQLAER